MVLARLVAKAGQLIGNETTNLVECWMHIRCKFDGGKVINRSQSGSWEHRCMGAALQQNMGKQWGLHVWENVTESPPNQVFIDTTERSAKKLASDNTRKAREDVKRKRRSSKYKKTEDNSTAARKAYRRNDEDVTPDETSDDIPLEHLEQLKNGFYQTKVRVTPENAQEIERKTINQAENEDWINERRKRITASNVGAIAKMRASTQRSKKVKQLLYNSFKGNAATHYGISNEDDTREKYITYMKQHGHSNLSVEKCGLFVSTENPWLAGTPDGLVHDPDSTQPLGLLEIKNPYSVREMMISEAVEKPSFYLEKKEDNIYKLKPRHNYYYQVQCQLYCANRLWCDFVINTEKDMHVERIHRDPSWGNSNIDKLKIFYFSSLLPELACPRHHTGGIREI